MYKKVIKNLTILSINIILILFFVLSSISKASFYIDKANLYSKGECGQLLKYKGVIVRTEMVVYAKDGKEYPAYCLDVEKGGVTSSEGYTVTIDGLLTDVSVWRTIINGYPYKTPEQLGCQNANEAYTATKQAVYCIIYNRDEEQMNKYEGIGEAGQRTVVAMRNIVNTARNSSEVKISSQINITEKEDWKIDKINSKYISKTYKVSGSGVIQDYDITLSGNLPDGAKLVDEGNNEKSNFKSSECFKILLPIQELKNKNSFKINAKSKIETKPILYGKAPDSNMQDYAITASTYEEGEGMLTQEYLKNETKIKIIKQDLDTKERLKGAEFKLLDENKNIIKSDIVTNENGEAILNEIMPGKYYLKETKVLDGYNIYSELIQIDLEFNEEGIVIVNNSKLKNTEVTTSKRKINISNEKSQATIRQKENLIKLPKTGM